MPAVHARLDPIVNDATRGSLDAFVARGGKLIIFHGLADTLVAPGQSVAFYERQAAQLRGGRRIEDNASLFLPPGMMHCCGGTGPDAFNATPGQKSVGEGTGGLVCGNTGGGRNLKK